MGDCNNNNSIDKYFKELPPKKRRISHLQDHEEKKQDDGPTLNDGKVVLFTKKNKLSYLGSSLSSSIGSECTFCPCCMEHAEW